jgi:hypothetical protein
VKVMDDKSPSYGLCVQAYGGKKGLLTLKEDKHSGDQVVTSVDRTHQLYTEFRCVLFSPAQVGWSIRGTWGWQTASWWWSALHGMQETCISCKGALRPHACMHACMHACTPPLAGRTQSRCQLEALGVKVV